MKNYIVKELQKHKDCTRFFMPGHKAGEKFQKHFSDFASLDVTELSFSDNLQNPQTILKKSQRQAADFFGFERAFFLTNGSSQGIFATLNYLKKQNMRLAILKESHVSVYNACEVLNLPVVIFSSVEEFYKRTDEYDAACVINLDYFGQFLEIDWNFFAKNGKFLFVDGAHSITEKEHDSFKYADAIVVSTHKLLPAFTQTAILLVKNQDNYDKFLEAKNQISTTSPSYLLMASIEYAVMRLAKNDNKERLDKLKKTYLADFEKYILPSDYLRIVLDTSTLCNAKILQKQLEKRGVFAEFATYGKIVFLLGLDTTRSDFIVLRNALKEITNYKLQITNEDKIINEFDRHYAICDMRFAINPPSTLHPPHFAMPYLEARNAAHETISLQNSVGRICAKNICNFPPAIPVICAGEIITAEALEQCKTQNAKRKIEVVL